MLRNSGPSGALLAAALAFAGAAHGQAREPEPASSERHLEVSLHGRSMQASARSERAGWITLSVPFDELLLPRLAPRAVVPLPPHVLTATPAPGAPEAAPRVGFRQLRALSEFARRATVVALSVVGSAAERRRLDALGARARYSSLLPELRLRVLRNSDQALRWIPTTDDPYRITQADGTGLILEASATFRLDRLLFAREELGLERVRLESGGQRLKLEARVLEALLGWFRARELGCADESDDTARSLQILKVLELFIELDGLTAGWFADQVPELGRAVWGFPEAALGQCAAPGPAPPPAVSNPVASLEDSE